MVSFCCSLWQKGTSTASWARHGHPVGPHTPSWVLVPGEGHTIPQPPPLATQVSCIWKQMCACLLVPAAGISTSSANNVVFSWHWLWWLLSALMWYCWVKHFEGASHPATMKMNAVSDPTRWYVVFCVAVICHLNGKVLKLDNMLQGCGRGRDLVSRRTLDRDLAGRQDMPEALEARSLQVGEHQGRGLGVHHSSKNCQTCCRCWIKEGPRHLKTWTCSTRASSSRDCTHSTWASSSVDWTCVMDRVSHYFTPPVAWDICWHWLHMHLLHRVVRSSSVVTCFMQEV